MARVEIRCNGNELVNCDIKSMEEKKMENEILTNQEMYEKMKQQYDEADKMIENLKKYYRILDETPTEFEDILKQHEKHAEDLKCLKEQIDRAAVFKQCTKGLDKLFEMHNEWLQKEFGDSSDKANLEQSEDEDYLKDNEDVWSDDGISEEYDEEEYDETTHEELTRKKFIKTTGVIASVIALAVLVVKAVKKRR